MTPDTGAHARTAADLLHALGTGDEVEAAHLLGSLSHQDALGVLVQTTRMTLAVQRSVPGLTVEQMCDRTGQAAREGGPDALRV